MNKVFLWVIFLFLFRVETDSASFSLLYLHWLFIISKHFPECVKNKLQGFFFMLTFHLILFLRKYFSVICILPLSPLIALCGFHWTSQSFCLILVLFWLYIWITNGIFNTTYEMIEQTLIIIHCQEDIIFRSWQLNTGFCTYEAGSIPLGSPSVDVDFNISLHSGFVSACALCAGPWKTKELFFANGCSFYSITDSLPRSSFLLNCIKILSTTFHVTRHEPMLRTHISKTVD